MEGHLFESLYNRNVKKELGKNLIKGLSMFVPLKTVSIF